MDIEGLKKRLRSEYATQPIDVGSTGVAFALTDSYMLDEAADAIEQLQRELDQRLIALSQLNRELEEARNDAERLNWLLANATEIFFSDDAGGHYHSYKYDEEDAAKFKLAIDAARKKQG